MSDHSPEIPLAPSLFKYAAHILPNRPINLLVIGGDVAESQKQAETGFAARLSSSRFMLSLKGYLHGNTKKPDAASIDLLIVDARDFDILKLNDGFLTAIEAIAPRGRAVLVTNQDFLDSEHTQSLRHAITDRFSVTHIHVGSDASDPAVIWIGNAPPSIKQAVVLSRGGLPTGPKHLIDLPINAVRNTEHWSEIVPGDAIEDATSPDLLGSFFDVRRGVATGNDDFFILPATEIERLGLEGGAFRPVLPDPSMIDDEIIEGRPGGFPDTDERLMILQLSPQIDVASEFPNVDAHLQRGLESGVGTQPGWYALEQPPVPPIVCAAREGQPCCFFLNRSKAIATDRYVALYPKAAVAAAIETNASLTAQIWGAITKAVDNSDVDVTLDHLVRFEVPGLSQILPASH